MFNSVDFVFKHTYTKYLGQNRDRTKLNIMSFRTKCVSQLVHIFKERSIGGFRVCYLNNLN